MTRRAMGRRAADRRDLDRFLVRLATGECEAPAYEVADDGRLTRTVACEKCLPCRAGKVLRWAGLIDEIAVRVTDLAERRLCPDRRRVNGPKPLRTYPNRRQRRDRRCAAAPHRHADGRNSVCHAAALRRTAPAPQSAGAALASRRSEASSAGGAR